MLEIVGNIFRISLIHLSAGGQLKKGNRGSLVAIRHRGGSFHILTADVSSFVIWLIMKFGGRAKALPPPLELYPDSRTYVLLRQG
jgi:hypothetical protein